VEGRGYEPRETARYLKFFSICANFYIIAFIYKKQLNKHMEDYLKLFETTWEQVITISANIIGQR
jgi:hypothetical protein